MTFLVATMRAKDGTKNKIAFGETMSVADVAECLEEERVEDGNKFLSCELVEAGSPTEAFEDKPNLKKRGGRGIDVFFD